MPKAALSVCFARGQQSQLFLLHVTDNGLKRIHGLLPAAGLQSCNRGMDTLSAPEIYYVFGVLGFAGGKRFEQGDALLLFGVVEGKRADGALIVDGICAAFTIGLEIAFLARENKAAKSGLHLIGGEQ